MDKRLWLGLIWNYGGGWIFFFLDDRSRLRVYITRPLVSCLLVVLLNATRNTWFFLLSLFDHRHSSLNHRLISYSLSTTFQYLLLNIFDLLLEIILSHVVLIGANVHILNVLKDLKIISQKIGIEVHDRQGIQIYKDYQYASGPGFGEIPRNDADSDQRNEIESHKEPVAIDSDQLAGTHVLKFEEDSLGYTHLSANKQSYHSERSEVT